MQYPHWKLEANHIFIYMYKFTCIFLPGFKIKINNFLKYLFIYLASGVLVVACGIFMYHAESFTVVHTL